MKTASTVIFFLSFLIAGHAQGYDTTAPYKKDPTIPAFSILQSDSTWFNKTALPKNEPVVIIYFSPDCGHCQLTAHEFVEKMDKFKDVFFVWISYLSVDKIKTFADEYKLSQYANVRLGRDPKYYVPSFYKVRFTPFIAVYNKNGKFMQAYEGGTDPATILKLLNAKS